MSERYAKYNVRVHAGYGKPVTVIASTRREAITRAIDLGWGDFQRSYARVTIDSIEDLDPRECPHAPEQVRQND